MPDAGREAPGVSIIEGPPCSWGIPRYSPRSLLVHLHSGPKPPFCPMMHQATRANYPPNSLGRVLPEKKFGGVNVGRRNSVQDSAGRVLPLSDLAPPPPSKRRPRAAQGASSGFYHGEASSCPNDLELPPTDTEASRFRRAHRPRKTRADPPLPSLEFAAESDGGVHLSNSVQGKPSTSGPRRPPADGNYIAGREAPGRLHCIPERFMRAPMTCLFIPSTWPEPMGQPRAL